MKRKVINENKAKSFRKIALKAYFFRLWYLYHKDRRKKNLCFKDANEFKKNVINRKLLAKGYLGIIMNKLDKREIDKKLEKISLSIQNKLNKSIKKLFFTMLRGILKDKLDKIKRNYYLRILKNALTNFKINANANRNYRIACLYNNKRIVRKCFNALKDYSNDKINKQNMLV